MAEAEAKEVRIRPNLENYVSGVSGSGKKTKRADHPVSAALDGFTIDETLAVCSKFCDIPAKELAERYGHLNAGQQKMNLSNRIRGEVNKRDKAHEADKSVPPGLKALAPYVEKGQAAVAKRNEAAATKRKDREAKAAKAKAEKDAKPAKPAKGGKKAA